MKLSPKASSCMPRRAASTSHRPNSPAGLMISSTARISPPVPSRTKRGPVMRPDHPRHVAAERRFGAGHVLGVAHRVDRSALEQVHRGLQDRGRVPATVQRLPRANDAHGPPGALYSRLAVPLGDETVQLIELHLEQPSGTAQPVFGRALDVARENLSKGGLVNAHRLGELRVGDAALVAELAEAVAERARFGERLRDDIGAEEFLLASHGHVAGVGGRCESSSVRSTNLSRSSTRNRCERTPGTRAGCGTQRSRMTVANRVRPPGRIHDCHVPRFGARSRPKRSRMYACASRVFSGFMARPRMVPIRYVSFRTRKPENFPTMRRREMSSLRTFGDPLTTCKGVARYTSSSREEVYAWANASIGNIWNPVRNEDRVPVYVSGNEQPLGGSVRTSNTYPVPHGNSVQRGRGRAALRALRSRSESRPG